MNGTYTGQMNFRFSDDVRQALENLAEKHDSSMTKVISNLVKNSAKRQGVWQK
jgi:predicted transcriptional regulator